MPFGLLIKFRVGVGRKGTPSLNHLISGAGKPFTCASILIASPAVTVNGCKGFTKDGFKCSANNNNKKFN